MIKTKDRHKVSKSQRESKAQQKIDTEAKRKFQRKANILIERT